MIKGYTSDKIEIQDFLLNSSYLIKGYMIKTETKYTINIIIDKNMYKWVVKNLECEIYNFHLYTDIISEITSGQYFREKDARLQFYSDDENIKEMLLSEDETVQQMALNLLIHDNEGNIPKQ